MRRQLFSGQLSLQELRTRLVSCAVRERCDGLFLPAVSNDGLRLAVDTIAKDFRDNTKAGFVLVDAAQAVGQIRTELGAGSADLIVGGAHKWIRAGLPLGFAVGPKQVLTECSRSLIDDPLASLVAGSGQFVVKPMTETVNVWPLIACNAAVHELSHSQQPLPGSLSRQAVVRDQVAAALKGSEWRMYEARTEFRSAIVMCKHSSFENVPHELWRERFHELGIDLTSYGNLIRLSPIMPIQPLEQEHLATAFALSIERKSGFSTPDRVTL